MVGRPTRRDLADDCQSIKKRENFCQLPKIIKYSYVIYPWPFFSSFFRPEYAAVISIVIIVNIFDAVIARKPIIMMISLYSCSGLVFENTLKIQMNSHLIAVRFRPFQFGSQFYGDLCVNSSRKSGCRSSTGISCFFSVGKKGPASALPLSALRVCVCVRFLFAIHAVSSEQ